MPLEVVALGAAAEFVQAVAAAVTAEQLKPQPSPERARKLAWSAYERLALLSDRTRAFVAALEQLESHDDPFGAEAGLDRQRVRTGLDDARSALHELSDAMWALDPQLRVHNPDLHAYIRRAGQRRGGALRKTDSVLDLPAD